VAGVENDDPLRVPFGIKRPDLVDQARPQGGW